VGADPATPAAQAHTPHVEGKYLIVYSEEGGHRNTAWEQKVATVHDNTLSYEREGRKHSLQLHFGPHQTLRASLSGAGASEGAEKESAAHGREYHGVYIASQQYLCLSLNREHGHREGGGEGRNRSGASASGAGHGTSSGSFILILRRQR